MYGVPYIFYFVHPIVKTGEIAVQRVNFEQLKNICPVTVHNWCRLTPCIQLMYGPALLFRMRFCLV